MSTITPIDTNTSIPRTNSNSKLQISSLYSSSEHEKTVTKMKQEIDVDEMMAATGSSTPATTVATDTSSSSSHENDNTEVSEVGDDNGSKPAAVAAVAEKDDDFANAEDDAGGAQGDDKPPAAPAAAEVSSDSPLPPPPPPPPAVTKQQEGDATKDDKKKEEEPTVAAAATATSATTQQTDDSDSSDSEDEIVPPRRIRSSIKLSTLNQDIPINLGRKSFRMLPKPDMDKVKKAATLPAYMSPEEVFRIMSGSTNHEEDRSNLNVKFGNVSIRAHEQTISDNPSVSYGTPIGLDWDYQQKEAVSLEDYEQQRDGKRREFKKLGLNYYQRKGILERQGHSETDIKKAKKEAEKEKFKRGVTKYFLPFQKIEDAAESGIRKMRRSFGGKKKSKK